MLGFKVDGMGHEEFAKKVTDAISGRSLGKIASFQCSGDTLKVVFSKLGKSEIEYKTVKSGSGFQASKLKEKIALTHRPLRSEIEGKLQKVMERLGAVIEK